MKNHVLSSLTIIGLMATLPTPAHAHGGQYRGPSDITPPSPTRGGGGTGPVGPTTGTPTNPSNPAPPGPVTPGATPPPTGGSTGAGGGRNPITGRPGLPIEEDFSRWQYWWEFNKDRYIRLKAAIYQGGVQSGGDEIFLGATKSSDAQDTLKPSNEQILRDILPALKKAIDTTEQRDIVSSCMVAMAKVGKNGNDFRLNSVFAPRLESRDLETQETAALAYGIAGLNEPDNVKMLIDLAKDTPAGRQACATAEINERTRSFATYGLGLLAHNLSDRAVKQEIFAALKSILAADRASGRNLKVAAVNAISLFNIPLSSGTAPDPLLVEAVTALFDYYDKDLGVGEQWMQSHVPPAIARLLGRDAGDMAKQARKRFALDLAGKGRKKKVSEQITRACALALGVMCQPYEDSKDKAPDNDYSELLLEQYRDNKDAQTRYFSILALGQIGGQQNRTAVVNAFEKAKSLEKPWCAIAMGVYSFEAYEVAERAQRTAVIDKSLGETLLAALRDNKSPDVRGGIAVALGLCRYTEAADDLRQLLVKSHEEQEQGYFCIGLALMNDRGAKVDIDNVITTSLRKPKLLQQAAVALGKLGDKTVADTLQKMLGDDDRNLAKLSAVASALGFIGDARTVQPLIKMLFDDRLTDLSRAFAAVALGGVGDKEDLPWNSKIGSNANYRAAVETLTGSGMGILDIL